MEKDISKKNISNLYLKLLPAQIFVVITNSLAGIVNGVLVGNNLSQNAMVALGFVGPLSALVGACAMIVSGGSGIVVGHHMGSGNSQKINKTFTISMILASAIGLFLTVVIAIFASPIAVILGADNNTVVLTASYIRGLCIGYVGQALLASLFTYLNMCNKAKVSLIMTAVMAILNLVFGLISVNVFKGSVFAIGLAAALSQIIVAIVSFIYIIKADNTVRLEKNAFDTKECLEIIKLGMPAAVCNILYPTRNIFINSFGLKVGGATSVNALAILLSCCGIFDAFNIGVGSTTLMLASLYAGEKDRKSMHKLAFTGIKYGLILAFMKVAILTCFGDKIAIIFGANGEVINEAALLLRMYSYSMPLNIFTIVIMSFYQSMGRTTLCNGLYLVNCILVPLFCCVFLTNSFYTSGIYICYALAEVVSLVVIYIIIIVKERCLVKTFDAILMIDHDFEKIDSFNISIQDINEVSEVSLKIIEYLNNKNIDSRRVKMTGLCAEEMAGNIVEHGFTKDKKKHVIDIYASVIEDEIFLRIKDDCIPFDPHTKLSQYNPEDPCHNIGIRMVCKIAKEMNYQVNFGMNVLTIKL